MRSKEWIGIRGGKLIKVRAEGWIGAGMMLPFWGVAYAENLDDDQGRLEPPTRLIK